MKYLFARFGEASTYSGLAALSLAGALAADLVNLHLLVLPAVVGAVVFAALAMGLPEKFRG